MEVSQIPKHQYKLAADDPYQGRDPGEFRKTPLDKLIRDIEAEKSALQSQQPQFAGEIESAYQLIYNTFLIPGKKEDVDPTERKVFNAQIQQNLAHHIYYGGRDLSDNIFSGEIFRIIETSQNLTGRLTGEKREARAPGFWYGTKSEVSVIKALKEQGYPVYIPDYTDPKDVFELDVAGGIDLFTIINASKAKGNVALLINVKTTRFPNPEVREYAGNPLMPYVSDLLGDLRVHRNKRVEVVVPHTPPFTPEIARPKLIDYKKAVRDFALLSDTQNSVIIQGLRDIVFS